MYDPIQSIQLNDIIINYIKSKGQIYHYKFKFNLSELNLQQVPLAKFKINDINFKNASIDIYKKFKHLDRLFIITIEHAGPYGIYFVNKVNKKFPNKCIGLITYPLRLYDLQGLERRIWKFKDNQGWNKYISTKYNINDYLLNINNNRLNEILDNVINKNQYMDESKSILMMIIDLLLRKQYSKIPLNFNCKTILFSRLDLDIDSIIELNYERKEIADMKKIVNEESALYNSMMWNFDRIKYDKSIIELNKNNDYVRIQYIIGGINDIDKKEIIDGIKLLID